MDRIRFRCSVRRILCTYLFNVNVHWSLWRFHTTSPSNYDVYCWNACKYCGQNEMWYKIWIILVSVSDLLYISALKIAPFLKFVSDSSHRWSQSDAWTSPAWPRVSLAAELPDANLTLLVIRRGPSSSAVAPTNSKHSGPQVNNIISRPIPHMGGAGNYKLCMSSHHATCITHSCTHSGRHTPRPPNHSAHFLTISSLSSATHTAPLPLCMSFSVTRLVQNCTEASCHSIEE